MQFSKNIFKSIEIMSPIYFQEIVFHPIKFLLKSPPLNIKTLNDLFDEKNIKVQEINYSGSVPNISVKNLSLEYLLIIDGEAIQGAKQNRIATNSVLVGPKTEITLPVNCVEQGRWSYKTSSFEKSSFSLSPNIRNKKTYCLKNGYDSQGVVWNEISQLSQNEKYISNTSDLGEILENKSCHKISDFENKIYKTECNGFLVQGIETNFIELFNNKKICFEQVKKGIKGWLCEQNPNKQIEKTPNFYLNELIFTKWSESTNIGEEDSYVNSGTDVGKAVLKGNVLLHAFKYF